jgi:hypothetical protein
MKAETIRKPFLSRKLDMIKPFHLKLWLLDRSRNTNGRITYSVQTIPN